MPDATNFGGRRLWRRNKGRRGLREEEEEGNGKKEEEEVGAGAHENTAREESRASFCKEHVL